MNARELGWVAGIIDGEGSLKLYKPKDITCRRGFRWQVSLRITNTDPKVVETMKSLIVGGSISCREHNGPWGKNLPWEAIGPLLRRMGLEYVQVGRESEDGSVTISAPTYACPDDLRPD